MLQEVRAANFKVTNLQHYLEKLLPAAVLVDNRYILQHMFFSHCNDPNLPSHQRQSLLISPP